MLTVARTPEEKAADEKLTEAIELVTQVYNPDLNMGILTDYIVIAAYQGFDADGDDETHVTMHPRDGSLPLYRIMGLLDYSQAHERGTVASADNVGEDDGD